MSQPRVSIVVRTFNEQKHLESLLKMLEQQTVTEREIVLVDSGSTDGTLEIAKKYCDKVIQMVSDAFTFGHSLNVGIQAARAPYIAMISAHTRPLRTDWLECLVAPLKREDVVLTYGRQLGVPTSNLSEITDFYINFPLQRAVKKAPDYFCNNANAAIKRAFWEIHPYDETLPGIEDVEWAKHFMDQGHLIVYEPQAAIYHIHEESSRQIRNRFYRETVASKKIGVQNCSRLRLTMQIASEFGKDCIHMARQRDLHRLREAIVYRTNKLAGIWKGLSRETLLPGEQEELYFPTSNVGVTITEPHHATLTEFNFPVLRPNEVMIEVAYVGVCATDIKVFEGKLEYYQKGEAHYPIIPGHEFSGRVIKVGPRVGPLAVGDLVVGECILGCGNCSACRGHHAIACVERKEVGVLNKNGAYARLVTLEQRYVHKLPSALPLDVATLVEPLAVVIKGLKRGRLWKLNSLKKIAIIGGGCLGHLAAQLLRKQGHDVTVFELEPGRRELIEKLGIRCGSALENLDRFEVILEASGSAAALQESLEKSKVGTLFLLYGLSYKKIPNFFDHIVSYDKEIIGSVGSSAEDFVEALTELPTLELSPFKGPVYELAHFKQAWEICAQQNFLKVRLRPS